MSSIAYNARICHQIALYCAPNARKTVKVLGQNLHKLRQRVLEDTYKNIQGRGDESPPATSMHSLYDGENIYSRRENAIFIKQVKIALPFS